MRGLKAVILAVAILLVVNSQIVLETVAKGTRVPTVPANPRPGTG